MKKTSKISETFKSNNNEINKEARSKSTIIPNNYNNNDDNNSSKFLDTESELIQVNKKMNNILQSIELQNKLLCDNVIIFFYFLVFPFGQ